MLKDGESWPTDLTTGQSVTLDIAYAPKDGTGGHNEADVALSNGTVFKAGADYDFAGVKPTKVRACAGAPARPSRDRGPGPTLGPGPD